MNKIVHFTGENFADVLEIVPGYVRCKRSGILELHIFIPFVGDKSITNSCYIVNNNNIIQVNYD
jgi:hypothetical protein